MGSSRKERSVNIQWHELESPFDKNKIWKLALIFSLQVLLLPTKFWVHFHFLPYSSLLLSSSQIRWKSNILFLSFSLYFLFLNTERWTGLRGPLKSPAPHESTTYIATLIYEWPKMLHWENNVCLQNKHIYKNIYYLIYLNHLTEVYKQHRCQKIQTNEKELIEKRYFAALEWIRNLPKIII